MKTGWRSLPLGAPTVRVERHAIVFRLIPNESCKQAEWVLTTWRLLLLISAMNLFRMAQTVCLTRTDL
jgi:hypothetical protein